MLSTVHARWARALAFSTLLSVAACGPGYLRDDKPRTVLCYTAKGSPVLTLGPRDGGRQVRIDAGQTTAVVDFRRADWSGDHYGNGQVRMTIDPEVHVYGLGQRGRYGPCM